MTRDTAQATYLSRQRRHLAAQLQAHVPPDARARQTAFLRAAQNPDGGFSGREGESDLYYTGFGFWCLDILGAITPEIAERGLRFVQANALSAKHLVDAFSLLHAFRLLQPFHSGDNAQPLDAAAVDVVLAALEGCRTPDGGYGRTPGQNAGSTYATFLTVLCHEEL